jgi:UDP-glucuronate decarboxylase
VNYLEEGHVDTRLVRIFNTYGPRMLFNDGRVVSNFIVQALRGESITIYGSGTQTRSFCFVDDLVRGLMAMMEKDGFTGPVNLGNPQELTIRQLAELVIELTGSGSKLIEKPLPKDDPTRRRPDTTLAEQMLGWRAEKNVRDGLALTIVDFDRRLKQGKGV